MFSRWWNLQERMMRQNPQLSLSRRFPNSDPFSTWYSCARPCRWTGRLAQQCPCEQRWLPSTRLIFPAWWRSAMFQMCFQVRHMSQKLQIRAFSVWLPQRHWNKCAVSSKEKLHKRGWLQIFISFYLKRCALICVWCCNSPIPCICSKI